jgi:hypothetical protein
VSVRRSARSAAVVLAVVSGLLAAVLAPAGAASAAPRPAAPAPVTALWVWDTATPDATLALARRQRVTTLLVHVVPDVTAKPAELAALRALVGRARTAGLKVEAVGGAPDWPQVSSWVVAHWLRPALMAATFDAVQLDVEPYLDPTWTTDRARAVAGFLSLLRTVDSATKLPLHAAVPFWFDQVPTATGESLARAVARVAPQVTVMAYRSALDGGNGLLALAEGTLRELQAGGGTGLVGVETLPIAEEDGGAALTFADDGLPALLSALDTVRRTFSASTSPVRSAYAGVAVHDVEGWAALGG